jgi:hypothetical protein
VIFIENLLEEGERFTLLRLFPSEQGPERANDLLDLFELDRDLPDIGGGSG